MGFHWKVRRVQFQSQERFDVSPLVPESSRRWYLCLEQRNVIEETSGPWLSLYTGEKFVQLKVNSLLMRGFQLDEDQHPYIYCTLLLYGKVIQHRTSRWILVYVSINFQHNFPSWATMCLIFILFCLIFSTILPSVCGFIEETMKMW